MQRNDGDNFSADDTELPAEELADGKSRFIDCNGLKVHYNVEQPQVVSPAFINVGFSTKQ